MPKFREKNVLGNNEKNSQKGFWKGLTKGPLIGNCILKKVSCRYWGEELFSHYCWRAYSCLSDHYKEHASPECVSLCLGHRQPTGKCQKSPSACRRKEKTQGTKISCLGLQPEKKAEGAQGDSGVWGEKCSMGFCSRESLFAVALHPASPLCLCSGGSLLCRYLRDSVSCCQAKGPLQGSTSGVRRRQEPHG